MIWHPNVTVAAIVEQEGRFLLVEEETAEGLLFNQPAGHLENGETLLAGVVRETMEETARPFTPTGLLGIYHWKHPERDLTYLRFAFTGEVGGHNPQQPLDAGILRTVWMTPEEIHASRHRHRSPQVLRCVEDYLRGQRFPLTVLAHLP